MVAMLTPNATISRVRPFWRTKMPKAMGAWVYISRAYGPAHPSDVNSDFEDVTMSNNEKLGID